MGKLIACVVTMFLCIAALLPTTEPVEQNVPVNVETVKESPLHPQQVRLPEVHTPEKTSEVAGKVDAKGNIIARQFGGTANINIPKGHKLILVTWKNDKMWYLTRPMRKEEYAETYTYQEDSRLGILEATLIIREHK